MKGLTIRYKIFFGVMTVIIGFIVVVNLAMLKLLKDIGQREVLLKLENAVLVYKRFDEQRHELMLVQAESLASTPFLKATLAIPDVDTETVDYAVSQLAYSRSISAILVLNNKGELMAEIGDLDDPGKLDVNSLPGVHQVLEGQPFYGGSHLGEQLYQLAMAPIVSGEQIVGLIVVAQHLDSEMALSALSEIAGTQVAMLFSDRALTAGTGEDDQVLFTSILSAGTKNAGKTLGTVSGLGIIEVEVAKGVYFTVLLPLVDDVQLLFYRAGNLLPSTLDSMQMIVLFSSSFALLLGILVSLWLSSRVSKPVLALTEAARKYAEGKFEIRVESPSNDELGELADSFNHMADEIIRHQTELVDSKERAEAASRAKSTFLATMSHEIRTPLNGVLGMTELMADTELQPNQQRFLKVITESGNNLMDIINNILDLSKIESGKLELHHGQIDLRHFVETISIVHAATAHNKGIGFVCNISPDIALKIEADVTRLRQVLTNLIGNAIKFTKEGFVEVIVTLLERDRQSTRLRFEVVDTGIGIAGDRVNEVFESFTQADGSTTRDYGGTGLGLSIARQLVELMGGQLEVTSALGQGSSFSFELCCPAESLPGLSMDDINFQKARVLVVDELVSSQRVLCNQIISWKMQCDAVTQAGECLNVLQKACTESQPYDVVILDRDQPEINGVHLVDRIMIDPQFSQIAIVQLVSTAESEDVMEVSRSGVLASITKPVRQSDLFDTLCAILGDRQVEQSPKSVANDLDGAFTGHSVLLVEDTIVNQKVAMAMLEKYGCEVKLADNGLIALDMLSKERFDLIFMDCQMPEMDGLEATRELRKREEANDLKPIPIIALTANALTGDRETCLMAGMNDFMAKPFKRKHFAEKLEKWLPGKDTKI